MFAYCTAITLILVMSAYFNLEKSFAFYGAYHNNPLNKIIHIVCVPLIFSSSIELLSRIAPQWFVSTMFEFYVLSFVKMEPAAGILYAPILGLFYWIGANYLSGHPHLSVVIFVISWIAQFTGHGIFEKRSPALLTNLPQSLHAAVFFVWWGVLFALGFKPKLDRKLLAAVARERKQRKFD